MNFAELMDNIFGADWLGTFVQILLGVFSVYLSHKMSKLKIDVVGFDSKSESTNKQIAEMVNTIKDLKEQNILLSDAVVKLADITASGFLDSRGITKDTKVAIGSTLNELKQIGVDAVAIKDKINQAIKADGLTAEEVNEIRDEVEGFAKNATQLATDIKQQSDEIYNEIINANKN